MEIKGLEKLKGIDKLNVRAFKDEEGWHLEIFKEKEGISFRNPVFWERDKDKVIVDLAKENNCTTADEVRALYDKLMELYHENWLYEYVGKRPSNGFHSICDEVDKRQLTLTLTSHQIEIIQDALIGFGLNGCSEVKWDVEDDRYKEYYDLLDMFFTTKRDKKELEQILKENREEYLRK